MAVRRRGVITPLVVMLMLLGTLGQPALSSAQFVQPDATETAPAEPTSAPVETEAPATDVPPTDIPATDIAPTVEPTVASTATVVPTTDPAVDAAAISQLSIQFEECQDTARVGVTDFFFDGAFGAAAIGVGCTGVGFVTGSAIQITLDDGGSNVYQALLDGNGQASFPNGEYPDVQEGSYSVAVSAGEDYFANMQGQIVLEEDGSYTLRIVRYAEGGQTSGGEDDATVSGSVFYCRDATRDGQIDVLIDGQPPVNEVRAQGEASECATPLPRQTDLTFTGTDYNGRTYTAAITQGDFVLSPVPYSNEQGYIFTNEASGDDSVPVIVGGSNGANLNLTVYVYYAEAAPLLPVLTAQKIVCAVTDPEDPRIGTPEFVIGPGQVDTSVPVFSAAASCYVDDRSLDPAVDLVLNGPEGYLESRSVFYTGQQVAFGPLQPGTYTLSESQGEIGYMGTSDSFDLAYGDVTNIQVVNYVAGGDPGTPDEGTTFFFRGQLLYCTSEELNGTVDFLIDRDNGGLGVQAQGTSECRAAERGEGVVSLRAYGADPEGPVLATYPAELGADGEFFAALFLASGYFQVVFSGGSFEDEFTSEIFAISDPFFFGSTDVTILAYVGEPTDTTDIEVEKTFCFDAARNGETDFFVNDRSNAPDDVDIQGAATTECASASYRFGTITYTLTNTGTGATATSVAATDGFPFGVSYGSFTNIPAGTYTLTEAGVFGEGETLETFDATSEPFTIAGDASYYVIDVKNYIDDEAPDGFQQDIYYVALDAFTCVDTGRSGEFDYFYQGESFQPSSVAATTTSECALSAPGEYEFVLDGPLPVDDVDVSAQAIYPLEPTGDSPQFEYDGNESLPGGTYVIRELVNGAESAPIVLDENFYQIQFYYYAAAPTPTPTLEPGVTPTATATLEPGITPTATVDLSEPTRIVGNPPVDSDGDGDPDPTDPDDDNDGTPDDQDPDNQGPDDQGVTQLPSTGQGSQDSGISLALVTLAGALALLAIAGLQAQRARR